MKSADESVMENAMEIRCGTREEAEQFAEDVVRIQMRLDRLVAERDGKAAEALRPIREEYEPEIKAIGELALAKSDAVQKWLEANRKEVLPDKEKQSFETAAAKVGFRWSPPRLDTAPGLNWDQVLDRIKKLKKRCVTLASGTKVSFLDRFVRIKETVNVDQLKKDLIGRLLEDGKELGVVVRQDEKFFISQR